MINCYWLILFDLDGTLTDSKVGIMNSLNYALKKSGIVEDNLENLILSLGRRWSTLSAILTGLAKKSRAGRKPLQGILRERAF